MSLPFDQQPQQPPPLAVAQNPYRPRGGSGGSVGPVVAVLAVIAVLGIIAGVIGRLCTGRRVIGCGQFDFEGWVEANCASCIDGRTDTPPTTTAPTGGRGGGGSVPIVIPAETASSPPEVKQSGRQIAPPQAAES